MSVRSMRVRPMRSRRMRIGRIKMAYRKKEHASLKNHWRTRRDIDVHKENPS